MTTISAKEADELMEAPLESFNNGYWQDNNHYLVWIETGGKK